MSLRKGTNTPLPRMATAVVSCAWDPHPTLDADLSALLLVGGKVRSDSDFVFYNQPESTDRTVEHAGKSISPDGSVLDRITVKVTQLDPSIDSIVFVVSLDGPPGSSLAELGQLSARLHAVDGIDPVCTFQIDGLSAETAAVTLELYRRDTWWKVRAVGQGYRDGLAGLARDFGVVVDDAAAPEAQPPADLLPSPLISPPHGPPTVDWTRPPVPAGYQI